MAIAKSMLGRLRGKLGNLSCYEGQDGQTIVRSSSVHRRTSNMEQQRQETEFGTLSKVAAILGYVLKTGFPKGKGVAAGSKGFLQVFRYYGPALVRRAIKERDFAAIDFTLLLCPFTLLTMIRIALGAIYAAFGFVTWQSQLGSLFNWVNGIVYSIIFMMALAALTIVVERKQIGATNKELFAYVLSFPIYMLSYVPISFQAVFAKAEWKPIEHKGGSAEPAGESSAEHAVESAAQ